MQREATTFTRSLVAKVSIPVQAAPAATTMVADLTVAQGAAIQTSITDDRCERAGGKLGVSRGAVFSFGVQAWVGRLALLRIFSEPSLIGVVEVKVLLRFL